MRLRHYSFRHIDVEVGLLGSSEILRFTGIYGFAAQGERVLTWDFLRTLAAQSSLPWLVAGDFNEILCNAEKSGGPQRGGAPMARFRETLVDCGLSDMGFVGSRFTWSNRFTKERLDRGCCSTSWKTLYPCSRVVTLSPNKSDHNLMLIEISADPVLHERRPHRFRFEEMWLQHNDCPAIIKQGWALPSLGEPMKQVWMKINSTGKLLMEWHLGVFQQRQVEMKLVQDKLDTLMRLPYATDQFEVQQALQRRYNELLSQDEIYWRQRSRVLWLKDGDRNSAFFHRRASNRKSRNKVKGLNDAAGNWQTNPELVSKILVQYYEGIFKSEGSDLEALDGILDSVHSRVSEDMNEALLAYYSDEEIKKALFQMHPSKSPGPDGMSPFFFQIFWHVVHHDVCLAVRNFLNSGQIFHESNYTHLTLIPKVKELKDATELRPIALCNVVYKIASKVLANRLKVILPKIVSPLQSTFVPGRQISNNTLVATEAAHFMHKLRRQSGGFFSLKLDINVD